MSAIPNVVLLSLAALAFTAGGVCMKYSEGLTRVGPSALLGTLFLIGAALQALAMRRADLSVAYVFVLGLESVLAFGFGVFLFGEAATASRIGGVVLITLGIWLLHR
jgi:multidrug transporter EmrE-like cation transporter